MNNYFEIKVIGPINRLSTTNRWFVSEDEIVFHRVGDVVDPELQSRPLRDLHKTRTSPGYYLPPVPLPVDCLGGLQHKNKSI